MLWCFLLVVSVYCCVLCLRVHIWLREFFRLCAHLCLFILVCVQLLYACDCVCVRVYLSVFKVCVVPLLVSGAEPLLTVISLFMQCEKGLVGAWTPHALIPLCHSPLVDPHAPPPPFRHPALLPSHPPSDSTPAQLCPPSVSRRPSFLSGFVNIRNISCYILLEVSEDATNSVG